MKVRQQQAGNRGYCQQQGNEFQRMMYDENNVITGEQRETKVSVIMPVNKHVPICLSISTPSCSITNINICAHAGEAGFTKL